MGAVGAVGFYEHIELAVCGILGSSGVHRCRLCAVMSGSVACIATVSAADKAEGFLCVLRRVAVVVRLPRVSGRIVFSVAHWGLRLWEILRHCGDFGYYCRYWGDLGRQRKKSLIRKYRRVG